MSTPAEHLRALLQLRIPFHGAEHEVELRVPSTGEIFPLLLEPQHRTPERMAVMFPAEFKRLVKAIDGQPMTIETARALYGEPESAGRIIAARNRLYEALAEQGRVFAQCPHCRQWEAELKLLALVVGLHAGPWPIIDERLFLAMPSLADPRPNGTRPPTLPRTSRLRFELPSHVVGLPAEAQTGILGDVDADGGRRERAAWERWVPPGTARAEGREMWREDVAGFRAMLRLSVALERLDGLVGEITPEVIARMPIVDFYFLDNLYYLVHNVDIASDTPLVIDCAQCGKRYLPVR